jgi:hypothetical protein
VPHHILPIYRTLPRCAASGQLELLGSINGNFSKIPRNRLKINENNKIKLKVVSDSCPTPKIILEKIKIRI